MMFNDNTLFYSILSSNILIFRIVFALSLTMKGSLLCHAIPCDTLQVQVSCQPLRPHCTQACAQDVQSPRHPSPHLPQGTWLGSQITPVNQLSPVTVVFCFNEDPNQFFFLVNLVVSGLCAVSRVWMDRALLLFVAIIVKPKILFLVLALKKSNMGKTICSTIEKYYMLQIC